uniref:F-ATPase delta subunit n=1 Tax=Ditylenchus dipsaci TaxID=166011 RepID=A0A915CZT4_9BILA
MQVSSLECASGVFGGKVTHSILLTLIYFSILGEKIEMLSSSLRSLVRFVPKRAYAAAAAASSTSPEAGGLKFTFACPDKAFYNNIVVKQVDVPTLAGMVGVLANHVPTIGILKPGVVQVYEEDGKVNKLFVSSGTLSVNIDGSCQVLAEEAMPIEEIDEALARKELETAQRQSNEGSDVQKAEASIRAEVADALIKP